MGILDAPALTRAQADARYAGHGPFLAATFRGDGGPDQSLYVLSSADGKDFAAHGENPVFVNVSPLRVRDPSIIYRAGQFYVAFNTADGGSGTNATLQIARSATPLRRGSWTIIASIDFTAAATAVGGSPSPQTWAPELFVDDNGDVYVTATINQQACYQAKATNATLTSWSTPARITINGTTHNPIDFQVLKIGTTYHMVFKDAITTSNDHATATAFTGPYTVVHAGTSWLGWPSATGIGYEGPYLAQIEPGRYRIYTDDVGQSRGLCWSETTDPTLASGWSTLTPCTIDGVANGGTLRHGSVLNLAGTDARGVVGQAVYGAPRPSGGMFARHRRTSTNVVITTSDWVYLDTTLDCVIGPVQPGDLIEFGASALWAGGESNEGFLTVATVNGGAGGTKRTDLGGTNFALGTGGLYTAQDDRQHPVGVHDYYTVTVDDIEPDATVRLSLMGKRGGWSTTSRTVLSDTNTALVLYARKAS